MALCFLNAHLHCVSWHVPEMVDANLTITVSYQNAFCLHGKQQRGELDPWLSWAHYGWIKAAKGYQNEDRFEFSVSGGQGYSHTNTQ